MSEPDQSPAGGEQERGLVQPTLRERWRPLEMLGLSTAFAAFAGVVTLIVMHPWGEFADQAAHGWLITLVAFGATFVVSLVVLAMLALGGYEPPKEPPSNVLDRDPH
ncbi:MAG TPA: hypothetical protein VNQ52_03595 [Microbacteriaceae bacterium]|nr:hypothetical protein [Microbacteriaceae bacterium]